MLQEMSDNSQLCLPRHPDMKTKEISKSHSSAKVEALSVITKKNTITLETMTPLWRLISTQKRSQLIIPLDIKLDYMMISLSKRLKIVAIRENQCQLQVVDFLKWLKLTNLSRKLYVRVQWVNHFHWSCKIKPLLFNKCSPLMQISRYQWWSPKAKTRAISHSNLYQWYLQDTILNWSKELVNQL